MTSSELVQWLQGLGWDFSISDGGEILLEEEFNEERIQALVEEIKNEGLDVHPIGVAWEYRPLTNFKGIVLMVDEEALPDLEGLKSYPLLKQLAQIEEDGTEVKPDAPEVVELTNRGLIQLTDRVARPTEKGRKAREANPARRGRPDNPGGGRPGGSDRS